MPKVSIIVPIYNVEKYLDRCMQSLMNQTLKDIEIIMVDDESPDNCPKMCDEYARRDERVKVIHKQNAGLGYARNSGLEIATGEYIAFVDSDDYVELSAYERMYNSVNKHKADTIFSGIKTETAPGVWREEETEGLESVLNKGEAYQFVLGMVANSPYVKEERSHSMSVWHSLYKKEIIDKYNLCFVSEREYVCEDIPFQVDFLTRCHSMVVLPFVCYYYCLNGASLTATFKQDKFEKYVKLRELLIDKLGTSRDIILRIDRFFIGYARVQTTQLLASTEKQKLRILRDISLHPVWKEVKNEFRADYLPMSQCVIYWLTYHHFINMLYIFNMLFMLGKKIMNKRI